MAGKGSKKEQRRLRKAAKKAEKEKQSSTTYLERDEWFDVLKNDFLDNNPLGFIMDGLLRNTVRMTSEIWARGFGDNPLMLGKNLLFLQLLVIDEDRLIHGKLYGIGRDVEPGHADVIRRSRHMFKEAVPLLLKDTDSWVFSRSLAFSGFNGTIDEAVKFPSYDPLGDLLAPEEDIPSSTRCAEVFLFVGGTFEVKGNGFSTRETVKELLQELYSDEDVLNLHGFSVVAASAKVRQDKLDELKGVHMTA